MAELINIGLVIMDVGSPRLLVQAGGDALERNAGIDVTTELCVVSIYIKAFVIHNNINELTNLFYCNYNGLQ